MSHDKVDGKCEVRVKRVAQGAPGVEPTRKKMKGDKMSSARELLKLGMQKVKENEFRYADHLYTKAIEEVNDMKVNADKEALLIEIGIRISEMHYYASERVHALQNLDRVKKSMDNRAFPKTETHVKRRVWELDMVSKLYGLLGDAIKGEIALKEFKDVAGDKVDTGSMFLSLKHVGNAYYLIRNYQKAAKLLVEAKEFADATRNRNSMQDANTQLAKCYFAMKRYEEVIVLLKATPFSRYAVSNIGHCYFNMKNFQKAIWWFTKAKDEFDRKIDTPDQATLTESMIQDIKDSRCMCYRIAQSHGAIGNYGEAVRMFEAMHKAPYDLVYFPDMNISRLVKYFKERMSAAQIRISNLVS